MNKNLEVKDNVDVVEELIDCIDEGLSAVSSEERCILLEDIEDIVDLSKFGKVEFKFEETISYDEYRWFVTKINVYKVFINGNKVGYIGAFEVGTIKSESMDRRDCGMELEVYPVEEYTKVSYRLALN